MKNTTGSHELCCKDNTTQVKRNAGTGLFFVNLAFFLIIVKKMFHWILRAPMLIVRHIPAAAPPSANTRHATAIRDTPAEHAARVRSGDMPQDTCRRHVRDSQPGFLHLANRLFGYRKQAICEGQIAYLGGLIMLFAKFNVRHCTKKA